MVSARDPAAKERAAIVQWLRDDAVRCGAAANAAVERDVKLAELTRAKHLVMAAACIERGAHEGSQP